MRAMKNPPFAKQTDANARPLTLADVCAKFVEQGFNVSPRNTGRNRT
jgi:hypothetical protein